jgi:hypothetical protein
LAAKRRKSHSAVAATTRRSEAEARQGNDGQRNVWQGNKTKGFSSHSSADYSSAKSLRKMATLTDCSKKQNLAGTELVIESATLHSPLPIPSSPISKSKARERHHANNIPFVSGTANGK